MAAAAALAEVHHVISHEYYGSNTCVSFCEIRLHYHYNDNHSISPKVLFDKNLRKNYDGRDVSS